MTKLNQQYPNHYARATLNRLRPPSGQARAALPMAPIARRADLARVVFVHNPNLPADTYGQASQGSGHARVDLCTSVLAGLTTNDREAWTTLFHEIAHVIFGDIDRPALSEGERAARERRAEAFGAFMLDAINDVLTQSVALHAEREVPPRRFDVVAEPGKAFAKFVRGAA